MTLADELLTVPEAAARLRISKWTFRHWLSDRKFPYVKMNGGLVRIRARDVQRFIYQNLVKVNIDDDGRA